MSFFKFINLSKSFGKSQVLKNLSFEVEAGEFIVILGPSGSGKTTLLNLIAGFEKPDTGELIMSNVNVANLAPEKRGIGMVFQKYTLYPNKTVSKNLSFPLEIQPFSSPEFQQDRLLKKSLSKKEIITEKVKELADKLGIEELLERNPHQLSGGQMQRVAIGRTLIRNSVKTVLLDEPFSSLDVSLRSQLQIELKQLTKERNLTVFFVTHDQSEAMKLADKIILLSAGNIIQIGTPTELYERPLNTFTASFFGTPRMNFIPCFLTANGKGISFDNSETYTTKAIAGIRPHLLQFNKETEDCIEVSFQILDSKFQGQYFEVSGLIGDKLVLLTTEQQIQNRLGVTVPVYIDRKKILLFDPISLDYLR